MPQNASKVRAENARYRLKPYASTSRKDGSPNERFSPWGDLADLVLHRRGRLTSPHHQEHAGRTETLRLLGYRFGGQFARTPPRPSRRRPPVQMIACVPPNQTGSAGWSEGHNNSAPLTKRKTSLRLLPLQWDYSPQLRTLITAMVPSTIIRGLRSQRACRKLSGRPARPRRPS